MVQFHFRRLWAVLAVYDAGSTLKAAERIHASQPAVTDAVAACEADIGTPLFERTSRGMIPTRAGEAWCQRLRAAAGHLKDGEAAIRTRTPLHRLVVESQLRALSAVIETGGFSAAARRLGLSQPSVQRAGRDLETLCGVSLWRRDRARVEPTTEARLLARHGDLCFRELALAYEDIREIQGFIEGSLRVGALPLARSQWLPRAMTATLKRFPDARVTIVDGPYDEQLNALTHGRIDFILGALRAEPYKDIAQEKVFADPVVIVVRADHPMAPGFDSMTDKLTPEQLGGLSWILPRTGTPGRGNFETFMAAKGLPSPRRVVECSSLVAAREMLSRSDHAAILSAQQIAADVASGLLKVMGPPLTGSLRDIGIATRAGFRPTLLQRTFIDALKAA